MARRTSSESITGRYEYRWYVEDTVTDPNDHSGCIPDFPTNVVHNTFVANGCCAPMCQDQTACEAESARRYRSSGCQCETLTCNNPDNCVDWPPCTPEHFFDEGCSCCKTPPEGSPIILDLKDNGISFSSPDTGMIFDLFSDGHPVRLSSPTSADAFWLALDRNGNGAIDNGSELFGNVTPLADGAKAHHGYAVLRELDSNSDGTLDASDIQFSKLILWRRPLPVDGKQLADEWLTVSSVISSIAYDAQEIGKTDRWGNRFRYRAEVRLKDGTRRWSYDVFLKLRQIRVTTDAK